MPKISLYELLSYRLTELIKTNNEEQIEICDKLNISTHQIELWKKGLLEPSIQNLNLLANYFNVSVDYLTGNSKHKDIDEKLKLQLLQQILK